jgi:serine/threonine protein kinase
VSLDAQPTPEVIHPMGDVPQSPQPNQIVGGGRYILRWLLGEGGKCMVWQAQDERLNETVALKFLSSEAGADPRMLQELRKEALRARRLAHKNIVQLYDIYEAPDELPFMIMEFVDGGSLHTLRAQSENQFLCWDDYLKPITLQLCHALEHAHSEGSVHRDLKPANVMVDTRGRAKLTDFGISATINDVYTQVLGLRDTRGTLPFMSPQQMDGGPADPTDDVYALGATLYELLSSRAPFFTGDIGHQVKQVPPQPIQACQQELKIDNPIPPNVAALIMACLRKNPAERPQSAWDVAKHIDPSIGDPLVTIRVERAPVEGDLSQVPVVKKGFSWEFYVVMAVLLVLLVVTFVILYYVAKFKP